MLNVRNTASEGIKDFMKDKGEQAAIRITATIG